MSCAPIPAHWDPIPLNTKQTGLRAPEKYMQSLDNLTPLPPSLPHSETNK